MKATAQPWQRRIHLLGMWVNSLGGGAYNIALPLIVLQTSGSLAQMSLVAIAAQIPKAFPGILIGGLADRMSPKLMTHIGYWGQAIVVGALTLAIHAGLTSVWMLVLGAFMRGSLDMFARTATFVSIPQMYGDGAKKFNANVSTAWTSASIAGPAIGGALSAVWGPWWLLAVDAISFTIIALVTYLLPWPEKPAPEQDRAGFFRDLSAGYRRLTRLPGFWRFAVAVCLVGFLYAPLATLAIYQTSEVLGQSSTEVGIVSACAAVGLLAGSLISGWVASWTPGTLMRRSSWFMAGGMLLFFVPNWWSVAAATFLVCTGGIAWTVGRTSLIHETIPASDLGKTMTVVQFMETIVSPIALALTTVLMGLAPAAAFAALLIAALGSGLLAPRTSDLTSHDSSSGHTIKTGEKQG